MMVDKCQSMAIISIYNIVHTALHWPRNSCVFDLSVGAGRGVRNICWISWISIRIQNSQHRCRLYRLQWTFLAHTIFSSVSFNFLASVYNIKRDWLWILITQFSHRIKLPFVPKRALTAVHNKTDRIFVVVRRYVQIRIQRKLQSLFNFIFSFFCKYQSVNRINRIRKYKKLNPWKCVTCYRMSLIKLAGMPFGLTRSINCRSWVCTNRKKCSEIIIPISQVPKLHFVGLQCILPQKKYSASA